MNETLFYQAENARTGDVIPKYINGTYQIFYLKGWIDREAPGVVPGWHRMESTDLVRFREETPIHVLGGTGDLIFHDGQWHLFACIFPDGKQLVTHYISKDGSLDSWEYIEEDTFGPDGEIYHKSDWRDPRIVYDAENQEFRMYLAARANDSHTQTGCVGLCVSKDLKHWEYRQPAYYPRRFNGACECPDFFTVGNWEYLVFSSYTTLFGVYYVKRPLGTEDWQLPRNHRLDSRGFYAAKTAGDGKRRFLFGWNPTKEENIFGFWPDRMTAQDYRTWDWGGSMVIHELKQLPDGDLALCLPEEKRALFSRKTENTCLSRTPGWKQTGDALTAMDSAAQNLMLMQALPEQALVSVTIHPEDARQCGILLQADTELGKGYYLYIEPDSHRLVFRSWLRMYEEGGKTFPYDTELEVPLRAPEDGTYRLEILADGSAATAYVNREAAMSFRMYDLCHRHAGLFSFGRASFTDCTISGLDCP